jgi:hypothetical protein
LAGLPLKEAAKKIPFILFILSKFTIRTPPIPFSGRDERLRVPNTAASRRSALLLCPIFSPFTILNSPPNQG